MRVIALPCRPDHVCARYRLAAFRSLLCADGIDLCVASWPAWWLPGLPFLRALKEADVVLVQRRLLASWQLRWLRRAARLLIFDFDDAVFLRDSYDHRGLTCPRRQRRFVHMVRTADLVVAGNHYLAEQAARWTAADKVHVIPTCLDAATYPLSRHERCGQGVELAWIGSASTLRGLDRMRPLLEHFGKSVPGLNLKVICDRSIELTCLPVRFCPWSQETEAGDLAAADIGISWLPDDSWSRGKCGLKVLQYMAAGLPVVANPVGVQRDLVRHEENGFVAASREEWLDAVQRLAQDPELRRKLGGAGRRHVERHFPTKRGAASWLNLLTASSRRRPVASPLA